jgi:hypothetical protein
MNIGKFLERMDNDYHHEHHRPFGWVFCDLLDYYYGMSARALLREECQDRHKLLRVPLLACVLLTFKLSNSRIKWGDPVRRQTPEIDETDTTAAEFDAMWDDALTEEEYNEALLDWEEELIAKYGKTSWELADEAEQGYDPAKFKPHQRPE